MNNKELKKYIIDNGGVTLNASKQTINKNNGYMVSIYGMEYQTKDINDVLKKIDEYIELIKDVNGVYVGVWDDNGIYYVDLSKHIIRRRDAEIYGRNNKQLAIYDLKNNDSVYLNYNDVFYSLYEVIRDKKTKEEIDQRFMNIYDRVRDIPANYRNDNFNYRIYKDELNIHEY